MGCFPRQGDPEVRRPPQDCPPPPLRKFTLWQGPHRIPRRDAAGPRYTERLFVESSLLSRRPKGRVGLWPGEGPASILCMLNNPFLSQRRPTQCSGSSKRDRQSLGHSLPSPRRKGAQEWALVDVHTGTLAACHPGPGWLPVASGVPSTSKVTFDMLSKEGHGLCPTLPRCLPLTRRFPSSVPVLRPLRPSAGLWLPLDYGSRDFRVAVRSLQA